jgi:hypothetical protein
MSEHATVEYYEKKIATLEDKLEQIRHYAELMGLTIFVNIIDGK